MGIAVAALLIAPPALASSAAPSIVVSAPFRGHLGAVYDLTNQSGCSKSLLPVPSFFHFKTGKGGFAIESRERSCASATTSLAETTGGFDANVSLALPSGNHTVTLNWTLNATVNLSRTDGICAGSSSNSYYCYESVLVEITMQWYVVDLTSGFSYSAVQPYWPEYSVSSSSFVSCAGGHCSTGSSPAPGLYAFTTTSSSVLPLSGLNSGHHYVLVFSLGARVAAGVTMGSASLSGATGLARLDAASPGLGVSLDTLSVA